MVLKTSTLVVALCCGLITACQSAASLTPVEAPAALPQGYELSWQDEFDREGRPDHRKWSFDTRGNQYRWWNGELQYYTRNDLRNAYVQNGYLYIEALEGAPEVTPEGGYAGQQYTSARLVTRGKQSWTGGFFEVRARLPCAYGTWPAIWLLGHEYPGNYWPDSGEIDIMEHVGQEPKVIHGTIHTAKYNHKLNSGQGAKKRLPTACDEFHRYQLLWTDDKISVGVDDEFYFHLDNDGTGKAAWPFDEPQYMILNLAIGGWGGKNKNKLARTSFPQRFEIDYVRVFQPID